MIKIYNDVIFDVDGLKISSEMKEAIEKLEKQYGKFYKSFFIEKNDKARAVSGFYDGCHLVDYIFKRRSFVVTHNGTIY